MFKKKFILPDLVTLDVKVLEILLESEPRNFGDPNSDDYIEYPW